MLVSFRLNLWFYTFSRFRFTLFVLSLRRLVALVLTFLFLLALSFLFLLTLSFLVFLVLVSCFFFFLRLASFAFLLRLAVFWFNCVRHALLNSVLLRAGFYKSHSVKKDTRLTT
ncbi:hypothetical protein K439DRAFT_1616538 [Ramaria rubella]|nr:hypothetical protein K439DRAFT_1616538 [Ramaria rubella]